MILSKIIEHVNVLETRGEMGVEISQVELDSRHVTEECLFIALKGTRMDGHSFIPKAIASGAKAILQSDPLPSDLPVGITFIRVPDTEVALGIVATTFFGNPTQKMKLVGVTGTNGKTTTATLLYHLFRAMGYHCGLVSTVANYVDGEELPTEHTTPDAITLNRLLAHMAEKGCAYAFMECSSHAICQHRIGGLEFAGGIFTNLTRDHLDFHKTFEAYRDAKKGFFDMLPKDAFAIINADDRNAQFMVQNCAATVRTYSTRTEADAKGKILEESLEGMLLEIDGVEVSVRFVGRFNVANLLAVYSAAMALGGNRNEVLRIISTLNPVNGRFETIHSPKGINAVVDYAHTPDALENVLSALNEIIRNRAQIITVCGAGGNRDKGKRPLMAQEAARQSDRLILTSDNPRFEEPEAIIQDMYEGLDDEARTRTICITDRREAIRAAVALAKKGDVILIAGKGHEPYQEVKGVKHHFDDHEVVQEAFAMP